MTLSNLFSGPVFNALFREVFSRELGDRSEKLVEDVKAFMQETLGSLCEHACAVHPVLLNELSANLMEEFLDAKERATRVAVESIIEAELGWALT